MRTLRERLEGRTHSALWGAKDWSEMALPFLGTWEWRFPFPTVTSSVCGGDALPLAGAATVGCFYVCFPHLEGPWKSTEMQPAEWDLEQIQP